MACREVASEKQVSKAYERWQKPGVTRRVLGHTWTGIVDLILLGVMALLLAAAQSTFERIVVAMLAYLHLQIAGAFERVGYVFRRTVAFFEDEVRTLRRLAGEGPSGEQRAEWVAQRAKLQWDLAREDVDLLICAVFRFIAWCLVVYALLSTIAGRL